MNWHQSLGARQCQAGPTFGGSVHSGPHCFADGAILQHSHRECLEMVCGIVPELFLLCTTIKGIKPCLMRSTQVRSLVRLPRPVLDMHAGHHVDARGGHLCAVSRGDIPAPHQPEPLPREAGIHHLFPPTQQCLSFRPRAFKFFHAMPHVRWWHVLLSCHVRCC